MERRTDRHMENDTPIRMSRTSKNSYLYDEKNSIIGHEEVINLDAQTSIDLTKLSTQNSSREEYQKLKDYRDILGKTEEKKEEIIQEEEKKIYDINSILEDAKKNRVKYDELERKRKLRENQYVTLADTSQIDIEEKDKTLSKKDIDEKELTDLINTITSHNLLKEIEEAQNNEDGEKDGEILSELLATNIDLNLEDGIAEEYANQSKDKDKFVNSFYTQSMDLSNQDFELSEEIEAERKTKIKILIIIMIALIIIIIGVVGYLILKDKGII